MEGNFLKLIKDTHEKPTANIMPNERTLDVLSLRSDMRRGHSFLPPLFDVVPEVLASAVSQGKGGGGISKMVEE